MFLNTIKYKSFSKVTAFSKWVGSIKFCQREREREREIEDRKKERENEIDR
jgi:hypothetical protein